MRKPRILILTEASFLSTGYAIYAREVMRRWHATGKYELFELASYGPYGDPRQAELPWAYMTAQPDPNNEAENAAFSANPINQFGEWKFDEACLRHQPDIVVTYRDPWMDSFVGRSPFRSRYSWAYMPTVDAQYQRDDWIETFLGCNAVFTYSDWALELLKEQGNGQIKLRCSAPPGADYEVFKPVSDKRAHRASFGIEADALIVGTVMRNQRRKLYPDLLEAFASFLKQAPSDLARRAYIYLHTSWPDVGWDIPRLIRENGLGAKVLMTYACRRCSTVFPAFFQDARSVCPRCRQPEAGFPNTHNGVSSSTLAAVYNLFDVYVQYSNSEGCGIPQIEAAACGLPVFSTDYSAMSDVVRKLDGFPVRVQRFYREPETHCYRALPDNNDFICKLIEVLSWPEPMRQRLGYRARKAAQEHYNWDATASHWEAFFDEVSLGDTWASPAQFVPPTQPPPDNLSDADFARWGISQVAGRPDLANSLMLARLQRDLSWGATYDDAGRYYPFSREHALERFWGMAQKHNEWEAKRAALLSRGGSLS